MIARIDAQRHLDRPETAGERLFMTNTATLAVSGTVRGEVVPPAGLTILVWTCRCHGYAYSHPSCCLHTDCKNLIPPPELKGHNASGEGRP